MPTHKKPGSTIGISILFLIFTSWLTAQDDLPSDSSLVVTREPAVWALQFNINGRFSLGPLYGGNVSVLHYNTPQSAIRFGLSLSAGMSIDEEDDGVDVCDSKDYSAYITLQTHYLRFPKPSARGRVYWGGGPILSAFQSIEKEDYSLSDTGQEQTRWNYSIGAVGVIGYSWQITQHLELFAEYLTVLSYRYSYEEFEIIYISQEDKYIEKGTELSIQPGATVLGISLYF